MRRYLIGLVSTFVLLVALWYRFTPLTAFFWGALLIGPVLFIPARWWAVLGLAGLAAEPIVGFVKGEDAVEQLAKIIFLCFVVAVIQMVSEMTYRRIAALVRARKDRKREEQAMFIE